MNLPSNFTTKVKYPKFSDDGELQSKRSGVKIYADYAEIIGNIYENPELLEQSNEK